MHTRGALGAGVRRRVWSPEYDGVEVERVLDDAGGGRSDAQDVLLGGQVVFAGYPVQVRQVPEDTHTGTQTVSGCVLSQLVAFATKHAHTVIRALLA